MRHFLSDEDKNQIHIAIKNLSIKYDHCFSYNYCYPDPNTNTVEICTCADFDKNDFEAAASDLAKVDVEITDMDVYSDEYEFSEKRKRRMLYYIQELVENGKKRKFD